MSIVKRAGTGLRALINGRRNDEEFDAELQGYLDAAIDAGVAAGLSREAATQKARRELGNVSALKDRVRDVGWETRAESYWRDLHYGVRMLRKSPGFATVSILSLALGIGATTGVFSILNGLLLKPLPVKNPADLAVLGSDRQEALPLNYPAWKALREAQVLPRPTAWATDRIALTENPALQFAHAIWATGDVFEVLGVSAAIGRTFTASDDRRDGGPDGPVAVLGHAFWRRHFGQAEDVIGRRLVIERVPFTIIGVTPPGFFGLDVGESFDVLLPLETEPLLGRVPRRLDSQNWPWLRVMTRLDSGRTPASLNEELQVAQSLIRRVTMPAFAHAEDRAQYLGERWTMQAAPGGVSHLRRQYDVALVTLLSVATLVLLVACTSVATLSLARSRARRHEFIVRRALGAGRGRLLRQVLIESLLLAVIGATLGFAISHWGSRWVVDQLSTWVSATYLDVTIDWRVLGVTTLATVATAMLCGVVPGYRSTKLAAVEMVAPHGVRCIGDQAGRTAGILIVVQVAVSLVLVVGAGLFLRSFSALAYRDLGFDRDRLLIAAVDTRRTAVPVEGRHDLYERLRVAVAEVPGVERAALSLATPMGSAGVRLTPEFLVRPPGQATDDVARILTVPVSQDWFSAFGTRLIAGRDFTPHDRQGAQDVAVVNDAFARRYFGDAMPVGQMLIEKRSPTERRALQIVGLVEDAAFTTIREPAPPTVYKPLAQQLDARLLTAIPSVSLSIRARDEWSPERLSDPVTTAIVGLDPHLTVFNQTVTLQLRHLYARERLLAGLSGLFGALALLLAAMGLYGVTAYSARLRRRELGLRMALGANRRRVLVDVVGRVGWLLAAGMTIGILGSLWATRFVHALLFAVDPRDPTTFLGAVALLVVVGALAAWLPARRATTIDPAVVLRES